MGWVNSLPSRCWELGAITLRANLCSYDLYYEGLRANLGLGLWELGLKHGNTEQSRARYFPIRGSLGWLQLPQRKVRMIVPWIPPRLAQDKVYIKPSGNCKSQCIITVIAISFLYRLGFSHCGLKKSFIHSSVHSFLLCEKSGIVLGVGIQKWTEWQFLSWESWVSVLT